MKIKRYIDSDMRQVLRRVRHEQGPDAVILSNRRVDGGIEVIAAIDYDEALMRQAMGPSPAAISDVAQKQASSARSTGNDATAAEEHAAPVVRGQRPQSREAAAPSVERPVASRPAPDTEQTADGIPALAGMQSELSSLRGLLETQLSGLLWKENARRSPLRAQILRNLARIGLAPDVASTIVNGLEPVENLKGLWHEPLSRLAQAIPVVSDGLLSTGGAAALIGPTGVGKTTTIAKIAARYAMQNGADEIALICADAWRIGAREHLEAFANIIGVKVFAASDPDELHGLLDRLHAKKLILIDTEGLSQRDLELSKRLVGYSKDSARIRFYLTLSAANQEAGLDETVRTFSKLPLTGAVITKIDEAAQLGCVIGALIRHGLPAAWLSDGQRIPDDLHAADKKKLWLVSQAVECLESSEARVDERTMAENYGLASVVNA